MAKPNYSYEKRQRELAKKKKKEEKAARKAQGKVDGAGPGAEGVAADGDSAEEVPSETTPETSIAEATGPGTPGQAAAPAPAAI